MSEQTILLIDDDATLLELLASHLQTAGYHPVAALDGPSGLRLAAEAAPDLVVLDVMMPGMDGWQVCERLRATLRTKLPVPIIMLTAKGEEIEKLRGFRLGRRLRRRMRRRRERRDERGRQGRGDRDSGNPSHSFEPPRSAGPPAGKPCISVIVGIRTPAPRARPRRAATTG